MDSFLSKPALFLLCVVPITSLANDSAGTTAAGGITFIHSPEISLEREELTLSPTQIKVTYRFKNLTAYPITRDIYFPLPAYKMQGANATWDAEIDPQLNTRKDIPFTNFCVKVNGQKMTYQTLIRAKLKQQDITQRLQQAQIPLNPELVAGHIPLDDNQQAQQQQWLQKAARLNLLDEQHQPRWQKQILYTWRQTFPAKTTIIIEHDYRPAAGVFYAFQMLHQTPATRVKEDINAIKRIFHSNIANYLAIKPFKQWLIQRLQRPMSNPTCQDCNDTEPYAFFFNVNYILTTGANWAGPIKDFILTINYPTDGAVIYNRFYKQQALATQDRKGNKQIHIKDFIPTEELSVIFGLTTWPKRD